MIRRRTPLVAAAALALLAAPRAAPAQTERPDTTARLDTAAVASPSGIDSTITFAASDSVVYRLDRKMMLLFGKASLRYRELGLNAERVDIDWNTSILTARGVPDSTDTTGTGQRGLPVMNDGGDVYNGLEVAYNFRTKKGRIDLGRTEIEKGRYFGTSIKKVDEKVLYVRDGTYTTCEIGHPHYYFGSSEMKVTVQEQVVARPVVLWIADAPVFALPWGVFPNERGRRSGLLTPAYGVSSRGRYLTNIGYYWAINDYLDARFRGDVYSKGGYTFYGDFRYALRYILTGGLSASWGKVIAGEPGDPAYSDETVFNVRLNHDQSFDPTSRLLVDLNFLSNTYYQETSVDLNDLLKQNIVSNATYTKYWEGTPFSLTVNAQRDQNLTPTPGTVELSQTLPSVTFNMNQTYPFRSTPTGTRWHDLIGVTYNGQFINRLTRTTQPTGALTDERWGVQHSVTANASPKAGYITIAPFLSYVEKWYDRALSRTVDPGTGQLIDSEPRGFEAVRFFSAGIGASTRLFGVIQPGMFGVTAVRHQIIPTVSYSYQPDFSASRFGYYGRYVDTTGVEREYDKFAKGIFGGAPAGERQAINVNIGNVFEMKTLSGDSARSENKYQLLNLGVGFSYNFAADSLRWSEIGMDFRTNIGSILSVAGGSRFNLYQWQADPSDPRRGRRVDRFLVSEEGRLWDMTAFNVSIGTRFAGEQRQTTAGPILTEADSIARARRGGFVNLYDEEYPDFSIPWSLDLSWNFAQSEPAPGTIFRSSTLAARLAFNLTSLWKITANTNYDLLTRQISAPYITVYRDLHCWELNFSWTPVGQYRSYSVEIRLKAPQLRDLKITEQASTRGIY